MVKIAIITEPDLIWSLRAWERSIPVLKRQYKIEGLWICTDSSFGSKIKTDRWWYLRTFGTLNFFKLVLYHTLAQVKRVFAGFLGLRAINFEILCAKTSIPFYRTQSPNSQKFIDWVKDIGVDILIIQVGFILKKDIINSPNIAVINKHASLLPSNKGMFPYFWAYLKGEEQGVSYYIVDQGIDAGRIILRKKISINECDSMIQFYGYIFKHYPKMLDRTISLIINNEVDCDLVSSLSTYHSLPTRADYLNFSKVGGKIIRLKDLRIAWKM